MVKTNHKDYTELLCPKQRARARAVEHSMVSLFNTSAKGLGN